MTMKTLRSDRWHTLRHGMELRVQAGRPEFVYDPTPWEEQENDNAQEMVEAEQEIKDQVRAITGYVVRAVEWDQTIEGHGTVGSLVLEDAEGDAD